LVIRKILDTIPAIPQQVIEALPFVARIGVLANLLTESVGFIACFVAAIWKFRWWLITLALVHRVIGVHVAPGLVARSLIELICEVEDSRVQVEIAPSRSIVADFVTRPEKLVLCIDGWHAIFRIASKVL
jgi:hypothetical protein